MQKVLRNKLLEMGDGMEAAVSRTVRAGEIVFSPGFMGRDYWLMVDDMITDGVLRCVLSN